MSQHLEQESRYSTAIRLLASLDYDLTDIYRQHEVKRVEHETGQPTDLDLKYQLQVPKSWISHFEEVPILGVGTIRIDAQFRLSPGQRKVLKDMAGLTPTRTITVTDLDLYPNTTAVRTLTIRSNVHIPEHQRKHVLVKWTITSFGDFMQRAYDAEVEIEAVKVAEAKEKSPSKKTIKTLTVEEIAKDYL